MSGRAAGAGRAARNGVGECAQRPLVGPQAVSRLLAPLLPPCAPKRYGPVTRPEPCTVRTQGVCVVLGCPALLGPGSVPCERG